MFPFAGRRQGRAAVLQAMCGIAEHYMLESYKNEIVIVDGDRASVISDVSFTQRATKRILRFRVANFLHFQNGELIESREFSNSFDVVDRRSGASCSASPEMFNPAPSRAS